MRICIYKWEGAPELKAADRLIRESSIETPVSFIVDSRREVNTYLKEGQYFFSDIRKEGIVLYELDDESLPEPEPLSPADRLRVAKEHFDHRFRAASKFYKGAMFFLGEGDLNEAAFLMHVIGECEQHAGIGRLIEAFPRDQHRERAWLNTLNEAYVKARYSEHFEITDEALSWLGERTAELLKLVKIGCSELLERLERNNV